MIIFKINKEQQIAVVSREVIEDINCSEKDFVLISAKDKSMPNVEVKSKHMKDALFLCFDDIDGPYKNYIHMSDEHAKLIVDFVIKYKEYPFIVCQCEAGVSRSSAMAGAISRFLTGKDEDIMKYKFFYPNKYVYKKLNKAFTQIDIGSSRSNKISPEN